MTKPISYYSNIVKQIFLDRKVEKAIRDYFEIDRMMSCNYQNPDELQELDWIGDRKLVSTAPADAVNAATRAFASRSPNISVLPLTSSPNEYARVERIEQALAWELHHLNSKGKKPIGWQIVESAMKYCKVVLQVEYLPWALGDRVADNYRRAILRAGKFNWILHHPSTVFSVDGPYGLPEVVVKKSKHTIAWIVSMFGKDNEGVLKMLEHFDDESKYMDKELFVYDATSWTERAQWASEKEDGDPEYTFLLEEHNLPFLPWVIVDNEDPILGSVVDAGLWDNANAIRTIVFSKAIDMAARPGLWIRTLTGNLDNVHIDGSNPSQPLVTDATAEVQPLPPPQIDQQIAAVQQMADSEIFRTSVAQILVSIEDIGQTSTFSTVNAMLQAALTQLVLAQNTAERAMQQAFKQSLEWVDYSKKDWILYRKNTTKIGEGEYRKGDQIIITGKKPIDEIDPDERNVITPVDPEELYITVELQSVNIIDEQAQQNLAINQVERLGGSLSLIYDKHNMGDYKQHQIRRGEEDLVAATINAEVTRINMEPEIEAQIAAEQRQAEQMGAQQELAQASDEEAAMSEAMAKGNVESSRLNRNAAYAGQEGIDPRSGMQATIQGAPGMGREQITGETQQEQ